MPLLRNKNQPYFPDPDSPNRYQCGPEYYCHPITSGDTIYSQFYQTPCNENEVTDPEFDDVTYGADEVTNGDFLVNPAGNWTIGTGWAWDNVGFKMDFTPGVVGLLYQQIPTLVLGEVYRVKFDLTRTAGTVQVGFGLGSGSNYTDQLSITGSYDFTLQFNDSDVGNDIIIVLPSIDFNGSITNISVELVQYSYWITNSSWLLSGGKACHVVGATGDLVENVPNYIDAAGYYKLQFTVTNRTDGSVEVFASDATTAPITANGEYTFYLTPTLNGVVTVGAQPTFDGCISDIMVYKLRNDYTAELIDADGDITDISDAFSYYEDYVTLAYNFTASERANGCYTLNVYDQCLITSDNLAFNGDFATGFTDWTKANGSAYQYDDTGNQMTFKFDPFNQGATDYVVNGDFSSGAAWTLNAGWAIVGGKAVHTPGNTGTLFQTLTLPIPPPPILGYTYYLTFKISNWTVGSVNVALGSFSYNWAGNDTFISVYVPQAGGTVNLTITPTSNFDGELDDFGLITTFTTTAAGDPLLNNKIQPLLTPGTYQVEYDIISSTDANIKMNVALTGQAGSTNSVAGSYSYTTTYAQNGGRISLRAYFRKTSVLFPQYNLVAGEITVDNISYKKITPFEATYTSECLNYNADGFARTKMIVGYCDQNAFGFEFENTGFKLQQRAEIRSIAPTYPKTTNIMKMGTGNARVAYSEIEKYWQIHTDFASETFHDAMSAIISCDHFQIGDTESDGVEYIAEAEDYTPNWQTDGSYALATAVINVRVKEKGQVFNRHI